MTYDGVFVLLVFIACLQSGKTVTTDISSASFNQLPLSPNLTLKFIQSLNNFRVTSSAESTRENTILFVFRRQRQLPMLLAKKTLQLSQMKGKVQNR